MDVVQRQVPPDVAQLVAERVEQLADDHLGPSAVRAFVVAVLDQHDRGVVRAADVVAVGIDVAREVEDLLRRARELAGPHRGGRATDPPAHRPAEQRGEEGCGQDAELRLVELLPVEGEARDQERDREPHAGDRPAEGENGPAQGESGAPEPRPGGEPRRAEDGERLADDVAAEDSQRTGDVTASSSSSPPTSMSALASANSGTITKLAHAWRRYYSRSLAEIAEVRPSAAARASSGVGCSRKERVSAVTRSSSVRTGW